MSNKSDNLRLKRVGKLIAVIVLTVILGMAGWTAWFIYDVLNSASTTGAAASAPVSVQAETLNVDLLEKIEGNMATKISRPIPQAGGLRNPFIIPRVPWDAEPAAEEPAAEEPAAEEPAAEEPAAEEPAAAADQ